MLKVVLLDEKPALDEMIQWLGTTGIVDLAGAYSDPMELLDNLPAIKPDVVFMEAAMPGINGLELAAKLGELQEGIGIVFVTANPEYAVGAFRINALDYLLKPVNPEALKQALERGIRRKTGILTAKVAKAESQIVCFGGFEVFKAGYAEPIRFPTAKAKELFAYLLVYRNTNISKWTLCDSLWPELHSPDKLDHKLHVTMHRMKKTIKESGIAARISSQRGFYRMECDEICDYIMFEQAVVPMMAVENGKSRHGDPEAVNKAYYLYKGPLFANRDYDWCEAERERMSRYFASLSRTKARWHLEQKQYPQAEEVLIRLLRQMPFDEEAHEMLLSTYIALQDRAAFLSYYEKVKGIYMEELGTRVPEGLQQVYTDAQSILGSLPQDRSHR